MRDNLPTMLRAAAKEWREENKVVATGATRYDAALEEAADAIEELVLRDASAVVTEREPKLSATIKCDGAITCKEYVDTTTNLRFKT